MRFLCAFLTFPLGCSTFNSSPSICLSSCKQAQGKIQGKVREGMRAAVVVAGSQSAAGEAACKQWNHTCPPILIHTLHPWSSLPLQSSTQTLSPPRTAQKGGSHVPQVRGREAREKEAGGRKRSSMLPHACGPTSFRQIRVIGPRIPASVCVL